MVKYKKGQSGTPEMDQEAKKIAQGIQKPGQSKEQTKLIAQGIRKGIEIYKKQQNTKLRELDKQRKKAHKSESPMSDTTPVQQTEHKIQYLPWVLLVLTWVGIGSYFLLR